MDGDDGGGRAAGTEEEGEGGDGGVEGEGSRRGRESLQVESEELVGFGDYARAEVGNLEKWRHLRGGGGRGSLETVMS